MIHTSVLARCSFAATLMLFAAGCSSNPPITSGLNISRDESLATYYSHCAIQVQSVTRIQKKMGASAREINSAMQISSDFYELADAYSDKAFVDKASGEEGENILGVMQESPEKGMLYVINKSKECFENYNSLLKSKIQNRKVTQQSS